MNCISPINKAKINRAVIEQGFDFFYLENFKNNRINTKMFAYKLMVEFIAIVLDTSKTNEIVKMRLNVTFNTILWCRICFFQFFWYVHSFSCFHFRQIGKNLKKNKMKCVILMILCACLAIAFGNDEWVNVEKIICGKSDYPNLIPILL